MPSRIPAVDRPLAPAFRLLKGVLGFTVLALAAACGGDDKVSPNPELEFLVGDWEAVRFEVTPDAAPDQTLDVIEDLGGAFSLNVQPSGQYTAILEISGLISPPEIGTLAVDGDELVWTRTSPPPVTVSRTTFSNPANGRVIFAGASEVDLDGDQVDDPVTLEVEIVRQ